MNWAQELWNLWYVLPPWNNTFIICSLWNAEMTGKKLRKSWKVRVFKWFTIQRRCINLKRMAVCGEIHQVTFSEEFARVCLSLPCHPQMTDVQVSTVIDALNEMRWICLTFITVAARCSCHSRLYLAEASCAWRCCLGALCGQAALERVRMFGDLDYRGLDLADFETAELKEVRKERTAENIVGR